MCCPAHTMVDSATHTPFSGSCVLSLEFQILPILRRAIWASQDTNMYSIYSPATKTPVINTFWIRQFSTSKYLLPAVLCKTSALTTHYFFGAISFTIVPARNITLSTLHSLSVTLRDARLATQRG